MNSIIFHFSISRASVLHRRFSMICFFECIVIYRGALERKFKSYNYADVEHEADRATPQDRPLQVRPLSQVFFLSKFMHGRHQTSILLSRVHLASSMHTCS